MSYISGRNLQRLKKIENFTFIVCWERAIQVLVQKKNVFYTSPYKEAKFSKSKDFHIIITKHFFLILYFFYTRHALVFHFLRDFCIILTILTIFFFFFTFLYIHEKKILKYKIIYKNFSFAMIDKIYCLKISWITWKIVFLNAFFKEYNRLLFLKNNNI